MNTTFLSEETIRNYEYDWFKVQLKDLSKGKYDISKRSINEFYSIISDNSWNEINFHFEMHWTEKVPLSQISKEIKVVAHLESQHKKNTDIDKKARPFFAKNEVVFSDHPQRQNTIKEVSGMKLNGTVTSDFSSEEAAKKTIKEIIKILDSPAYKKCAEIADTFINELTNGKE